MDILKRGITSQDSPSSDTYKATFFSLSNKEGKDRIEELLKKDPSIVIHNEIEGQLRELIKSLNPSIKIKAEEYPDLIKAHLKGQNIDEYGVWVYYPWSRKLIHILDEEEFIEIRTNRNRYKITRDEQKLLKTKKIGIIGLSVGQSIALTMAIERIAGELRLADFDTAELSNLNRIRTGLHNLGVKKTIIAAREIAEIDPFINVRVFSDGLHTENMSEFFTGNGKLDLLVEVCDGLDIKIQSRFKARELQIPVVMDTNDRGMLDVERFDLEPQRPILHGLAGDLDPEKIKDLTNEEKIPYILKMVGADTISTRLKASMIEVEQTINTWPQLASSVTLGGALTTDVSRRILLDQYHDSGRYYVDLDELVADKESAAVKEKTETFDGPPEITKEEMLEIINGFPAQQPNDELTKDQVREIILAATAAPSGGNVQPWKFIYNSNRLFIFHDEYFSYSLLDYNNLGSYIAIGAVIENISIKAPLLGFDINTRYFPDPNTRKLVAIVEFIKNADAKAFPILAKGLFLRHTNRNINKAVELPQSVYDSLQASIKAYDGAELIVVKDRQKMNELGEICASSDMLRMLHPRGHYDAFEKEIRWTPEEAEEKKDGMDVATLGASKAEVAAFKIAKDAKAIAFLRTLEGGNAFKKLTRKSVDASSALGIITMPEYSELNFLKGGRAVERLWIEANLQNIACQPISQIVFMLARLKYGKGEGMGAYFTREFEILKNKLNALFPELENKQPVFIFRFCVAEEPEVKALRKKIDSVFTYI